MITDSFSDSQAPTFDSLDQVQSWILTSLLKQGSPVTSRGMPTLELYPVAFAIRSPRRRCITNPERRWSLPLALGEFCWHATGSNELGFIEYYALRWREFADGVAIIGSCYGHNIFHGKNEQPSQWTVLFIFCAWSHIPDERCYNYSIIKSASTRIRGTRRVRATSSS